MPISVFELVASKINLVDYIKEFTNKEIRQESDNEWKTTCFTNPESKGSFGIWFGEVKWHFKCFSCSFSGDVIDLHSSLNNLSMVEAVEDLAKKFGISIGAPESRGRKMDLHSGRRIVQKYLHNTLLHDKEAMQILDERGTTKEDVIKWGIGISDGHVYDHFKNEFREFFKGPEGPIPFLIEIGIAASKNNNTYDFIKEGKLTVPVMYRGNIASWHLHRLRKDDTSTRYQIQKKKWDPEVLFFNQEVAEKENEFFLVEGVFDVIQLEKAGKKAVAQLSESRERINWLKDLKSIDAHFEELGITKKIHVCFDRDESLGGQKMASRVCNALALYHNIILYKLPMGQDIDEYLVAGKSLDDIPREPIVQELSRVKIQNGKYWYQAPGKDTKLKILTNFVLDRKYMYIDEDGKKSYDVYLNRDDGYSVGPCKYESKNFTTPFAFKEWLGYYGDFFFAGSNIEIFELQKFLQQNTAPRAIIKKAVFGKTDEDLWIASNGIMKDGKIIKAEEGTDIVLYKGIDGAEGITTALKSDDVIKYEFPEETFEVDQILEYFLQFWPPHIAYPMLGFSTLCYYHDIVRHVYSKFPSGCFHADTRAGKSCAAKACASLLGSSNVRPSGDLSTIKGVAGLISTMSNLPIIVNENDEEKFAGLVKATYDGDVGIFKKFSQDASVGGRAVNTTLIITTEQVPQIPSVINRVIPFNFWNFEKPADIESLQEFEDFELDGITNNKNMGWMKALNGSSGEKTIIEDIKHTTRTFFEAKRSVDIRIVHNLSFVFGALNNAFFHLKLFKSLERIREKYKDDESKKGKRLFERAKKPSVEDLASYFTALIKEYESLTNIESPLRNFFTTIERMNIEGDKRLEKHIKFGQEDTGENFMIFQMKHLVPLVKEKDQRSERKLLLASETSLKNELRKKFNVKSEVVRIDKIKSCRGYKLPLDLLKKELGVTIHESTEQWKRDSNMYNEPSSDEVPF